MTMKAGLGSSNGLQRDVLSPPAAVMTATIINPVSNRTHACTGAKSIKHRLQEHQKEGSSPNARKNGFAASHRRPTNHYDSDGKKQVFIALKFARHFSIKSLIVCRNRKRVL